MTSDPLAIRARLEVLSDLPSLPEVARKILQLRSQPRPDANALATIIELDPSLSAQVLRYARSSLYGYQGKIDSAEAAIARVLGYETVLNLALALATTAPFQIPKVGPLGSTAYWNHAVQCAIIAQTVAHTVPSHKQCLASFAYLAGLLSDFGLLVLGHLCPEQYGRLNRMLQEDPSIELDYVELQLFGMNHAEAGARVLRRWDLPDELIITALKHQDARYSGLLEPYPQVVGLANHLLRQSAAEGGGEKITAALPAERLSALGIESEQLAKIAVRVASALGAIDSMLSRVAA